MLFRGAWSLSSRAGARASQARFLAAAQCPSALIYEPAPLSDVGQLPATRGRVQFPPLIMFCQGSGPACGLSAQGCLLLITGLPSVSVTAFRH